VISAAAPRIALHLPRRESPLSAHLVAAYDLLVEAGRVLPPSACLPPHLVHTVGDVAPPEPGPLHIRTVDVVPLRGGRLAVAPAWLRRERRHGAATTWLAHGYTAGRLLLEARLAPSGKLHCLPLVGVLAAQVPDDARARAVERAATRARLGLAPGARLVVTTAPDSAALAGGIGRWQRDIAAAHRPDIKLIEIGPAQPHGTHVITDMNGQRLGDLPLLSVFAGSDLFVATGRELAGCSLAVAAADWGIPLVAVATDSAAELVLTRGVGTVVAGGDAHIARAVLDELDGGLPHASATMPTPAVQDRLVEFARALLGIYRRVLRTAVVGGAA
jgi:hypothetical protein